MTDLAPPRWTDRLLFDLSRLVDLVRAENLRQIQRWGPKSWTPAEWSLILNEEVGELNKDLCDFHFGSGRSNARRHAIVSEAIQVATLALKIAEMA